MGANEIRAEIAHDALYPPHPIVNDEQTRQKIIDALGVEKVKERTSRNDLGRAGFHSIVQDANELDQHILYIVNTIKTQITEFGTSAIFGLTVTKQHVDECEKLMPGGTPCRVAAHDKYYIGFYWTKNS